MDGVSFIGVKINTTEKRAVLHTALRAPRGSKVMVDGKNVIEDVWVIGGVRGCLSRGIWFYPLIAPFNLFFLSFSSQLQRVLDQIKNYSDKIRSGEHRGVTGKLLKNVVAVGIGGSYLGNVHRDLGSVAYFP